MKTKKLEYTVGSENIFTDLGFKNPDKHLAKAMLASQINDLIIQKSLTPQMAGKLLGLDRVKISALKSGDLVSFSLERLFRFLNILGQSITIKVSPIKATKNSTTINVDLPTTKKIVIARSRPVAPTRALQARKK